MKSAIDLDVWPHKRHCKCAVLLYSEFCRLPATHVLRPLELGAYGQADGACEMVRPTTHVRVVRPQLCSHYRRQDYGTQWTREYLSDECWGSLEPTAALGHLAVLDEAEALELLGLGAEQEEIGAVGFAGAVLDQVLEVVLACKE